MYKNFQKLIDYWIYISVFVAFSLLLCACEQKEKRKEETRPVKTIIVGKQKILMTRKFPGKVLANKEVKLSFEVSGSLIALPIDEGDKVNKGQLLARLNPEKYQNHVTETKAVYIRAKADYERAKQLVQGGYISRADHDKKRAEYLVALANYNTALKDLRDTYLYAPFKGVVSRKFVDNYQKIEAKQDILLLQDISRVDVEIYVPENIILNLQKGQSRKFKVLFEGAPHLKFPISFKEYSSEADPETQTYRVVFTLVAPMKINVLPGMTATVMIPLPDFKSGSGKYFLIPVTAVFDGPDKKPSVWVVDPSTMMVKRVPVKITRLEGDAIRVLSGLHSGQRVVVAGVHFIREGQKVKLLEQDENKQP